MSSLSNSFSTECQALCEARNSPISKDFRPVTTKAKDSTAKVSWCSTRTRVSTKVCELCHCYCSAQSGEVETCLTNETQ
jgi:hypothetical protein